jgi:hypothetical protein
VKAVSSFHLSEHRLHRFSDDTSKTVDGIEHSLRDRRFSVHATKKVVKQEKVVPVENHRLHRLLHLFTGRFEKVSWMDVLKITKLSGFVSGSV